MRTSSKESILHSLWKIVRLLEKSRPTSWVAWLTNMGYANVDTIAVNCSVAVCSPPVHTMICAATIDIFPKPAVQTHFLMSGQKGTKRYYYRISQTTQGVHCISCYITDPTSPSAHYISHKSHYTLQIPQVTLHGGGHIGNQRKARAGRVLHGSPATKSNPAPPPLISTTRLTPDHHLHLFSCRD